jgi:hypothetical protein
MVDRPNAVVANQHRSAAQIRRRGSVVIAVRRSSSTDNGGTGRLRREPHDGILPVVAVSQASRRRVLGHVPRVHDGELAVVRATTSVDLAGAAAAHTGRVTRRVEATTGRSCQLLSPVMEGCGWFGYLVSPFLFTAGKGTQPFTTCRNGLYFKYKEPRVPLGTVSGNPTTASWVITARRSSGAANEATE